MSAKRYSRQSAADTLRRIDEGWDPWLAIGQFLDDWRTAEAAQRDGMVADALPDTAIEHPRWSALIAAAVDYLCAEDGLAAPAWTRRAEYRLTEPWFLYDGWRLRAWQIAETPVPFRMRNVFGGDRILARV